MSKLNAARALILIGVLVGVESLIQTFMHIGDPLFLISADHPGGPEHAWYHAFREAIGDIATITITLTVFFGKPWFRSPATWYITLIALVGYYAPFWVGIPFNSALAAPTIEAEIRHIIQAAVPLSALFLAKKDFFASVENTN